MSQLFKTARPHKISWQVLSSHSIASSSRTAVQPMGMDWTFEDDMVDGLFFCATAATLTSRRMGHTPFV